MFDVLDISKWNEVIDYNAMIKDVKGVIIRVGYRAMRTGKLYMDPKFDQHYNNLKDKTAIGIYWFTNAITVPEAEEEAQYVAEIIKKYKMNLVFPVMIDSEYSNNNHDGRADNLTKTQRTNIIKAFCHKIIVTTGYQAGIYASDSWFVNMLHYDQIEKYPKWVASYSKKPTRVKSYCAWQYTSRSPEAGVKYYGGVNGLDRSHWYSNPASIDDKSDNTKWEKVEEKKPAVSVVSISLDQMDKAGKEIVSKVTNKVGINIDMAKLVKGAKFTAPADRKIGLYSKGTDEIAYKYLVPHRTYFIWSVKLDNGRVRICKGANEYTSNGMVNYKDIVDLLEPPKVVEKLVSNIDDSLKKILPGKSELKAGELVTLNNVDMYSSSSKSTPVRQISGQYYIWSEVVHSNRIRITSQKDFVGVHGKVTAWINVEDI